MALMLGAIAATAPILVRILGEGYERAAVPLQILCAGLIFASASSFMNSILQGNGFQKRVAFVSTLTGLFSLVAVAIGGLLGGADGATAGLASSFVLQTCALLAPTLRVVREKKMGME